MINPITRKLYNYTCFSVVSTTKYYHQSYRQMSSTTPEKSNDAKIIAPYGSWKSPITSDLVSGSDKFLFGITVDCFGHLFWVESRPNESGRLLLVKQGEKEGDEPIDITPKEFCVRSVTHQLQGGAFCISGDTLFFSNYKDQRLYKQSISSKATLAALAFTETFKAGASLYGIADLKLLKEEMHKFESHYTNNLVGSESAYFERSPINFVYQLSCPVILFQGLEDKVVPPDQARRIYTALKEKGLPVALVEYQGEGHGFLKAETIKFTLEQQMVFLARMVGHFDVADEITPIRIDNFD